MGSKQEKRDSGRLVVYFIVEFQNLFKMRDKFQPRESVCKSPLECVSLSPGYQLNPG